MPDWLTFVMAVGALSTPFLVAEHRKLRMRLRQYENAYGEALPVSLPRLGERCERCGGVLALARMEDDFGPRLEVASDRWVKADGSPIFEEQSLNPEDVKRLESARGMLRGAWCPTCREYFAGLAQDGP